MKKNLTNTLKKISQPKLKPTIVVTGASSGIGLSFCSAFIKTIINNQKNNSSTILMIANNNNKLLQAKNKLLSISKSLNHNTQNEKNTASTSNIHILTLSVDLSNPKSITTIINFVESHYLMVETLINNAGIGHMGEIEGMSPTKITQLLNLNVTNLTILTREIIAHMRERQRQIENNHSLSNFFQPFIINVASVAGFIPFPLMAIYAASKSYVINFSEALAKETAIKTMSSCPIRIFTLCPGSTQTGFFARSGKEVPFSKGSFMSPDELVTFTLATIKHRMRKRNYNSMIIPGPKNMLLYLMGKLLPQKIMMYFALQIMKHRLENKVK